MNTAVQKNEYYELEIIDIGSNGEGIGKINDFTLFIPNTIKGDYAKVKVIKTKKSFGFAKLIEIITPSPIRTQPTCEVAHQCGGCQLQHIDYNAQLEWKTKKVQDAIERIGGLKGITVQPTLGMQEPWQYRNKAQYPIRQSEDGTLQIGFFASRSHRIVPMENCMLQDESNDAIIQVVKDFLTKYKISIYDETTHKGLVRHLIIKTGYFTDEHMVCLVINGKELPHAEKFVEEMTEQVKTVTSIVLNHNTNKTNVILSNTVTVLHGKDYIIDKIGELSFKISPLAFFQVNPLQTKVLYDKALEYANLTGKEVVWDAYCGIGSISLFLAQKAKHVYGVEIVEPAIVNAKENARLNGITNTDFYAGKAEEVIPRLYEEGVIADTIVVDPPRKGCDAKLLETIIKMNPNRVVYVSCDPATLARDLGYLTEQGYSVEEVQPVDMFPHTTHIETVVLLVK